MRQKLVLFLLALVASVSAVAGTVQLPQMFSTMPPPMSFDKVQVFGLDYLGQSVDTQVLATSRDSLGWSTVNTGAGWAQMSGPGTSILMYTVALDISALPAYLDAYLIQGSTVVLANRWTYSNSGLAMMGIPVSTYQLDSGTGNMTVLDPSATATPEPSTIALFAAGGVLLLIGKRKYAG